MYKYIDILFYYIEALLKLQSLGTFTRVAGG